jgi:hypothetical protein
MQASKLPEFGALPSGVKSPALGMAPAEPVPRAEPVPLIQGQPSALATTRHV